MKYFLKLTLATLILAFLLSSQVSARTDWGNRDASFYDDVTGYGYSRTLSGATWVYYSLDGYSPKDNETMPVPFNDRATTKISVPISACKPYGGFWVLMRNEYQKTGADSENGTSSKLTSGLAGAIRLEDVFYSKQGDSAAPSIDGIENHITYFEPSRLPKEKPDDSGGPFQPIKYGTMSEVYQAYNKMLDTDIIPHSGEYGWDGASKLSYFCSSQTGDHSTESKDFVTFSTVSFNDGGYTSAPVIGGISYIGDRKTGDSQNPSLVVPAGATIGEITFNHHIAKIATTGKIADSELTIQKISRTINGVTGDSDYGAKVSTVEMNNSGNRTRINGVDYYSSNFSKTVSGQTISSSPITICETVEFAAAMYTTNLSSNTVSPGPGTVSSTACITFTPKESTGTVVESCNQASDGRYMYGSLTNSSGNYFGNTVATVGLSLNGKLEYTSAAIKSSADSDLYNGSTVVAYAKPGDVVQFSYGICFGAPSVGGMFSWTSDNYVSTDFEVYIGAGTSDDDQDEFLFGREDGILGHGNVRVNNTQAKNGNFSYKSFFYDTVSDTIQADNSHYLTIDPSRRELRFASPDDKPKDEVSYETDEDGNVVIDEETGLPSVDNRDYYTCNELENIASLSYSNLGAGGYVIPGFGAGYLEEHPDCASAKLSRTNADRSSKTPMPSLVGASLSQTLKYQATSVWPQYLSKGGITHSYDAFSSPTAGGIGGNSSYRNVTELKYAASQYENAYDDYVNGYVPSGQKIYTDSWAYKTATVRIPYNFETSLEFSITTDSENTVYQGEKFSVSANVDILPRANPLTSDSYVNDAGETIYTPYATITPPNTSVNIIELVIPENVTKDQVKGITSGGDFDYSGSQICTHLMNLLDEITSGGECQVNIVKGTGATNKVDQTPGNSGSNPSGEMGYYHVDKLEKTVPDIEAGYKYCIALGINYSDSHNNPGGDLKTLEQLGYASETVEARDNPAYAANKWSVGNSIDNYVARHWRTSGFTCRSVAKKPNFEVWNGGVYSGNSISGSITKKSPNSKVGYTQSEVPSSVYFGSWAEYYVVAKGSVNNFASASALGFSDRFTWQWVTKAVDPATHKPLEKDGQLLFKKYIGNTAQPFLWNRYQEFTDDQTPPTLKETGKSSSLSAVADGVDLRNYCNMTHLTIANVNCDDNPPSAGDYATAETDNGVLKSFKARIVDYYTNNAAKVGDPGVIDSGVESDHPVSGVQNGASYLKVLNNYNINVPIIQTAGTRVIHAKGHLDINSNICVGDDGTCHEKYPDPLQFKDWDSINAALLGLAPDVNDTTIQADRARTVYQAFEGTSNQYGSNNLSLGYRNNDSFDSSNIQNLPQVIIIAESISISNNVSQIDAWLITDSDTPIEQNGYSGGYINTCKEFSNSDTGASACWKTLKVNGPVMTSALLLNRTGGAWAGLTSDIGNPVYDVLRAVYNHYYSKWSEVASAQCAGEENDISRRRCEIQQRKALSDAFFENLGSEENQTREWRAYKAVDYYSADMYSISSGRASSRDLTCDGSITPAEIFDLHPLTYLWAYGEALKGNQAVITYAQEFAPRY